MSKIEPHKRFNEQMYFFELKLHNPDGGEVILNPQAVLQLVIEDELLFWPIRGFFIYENPMEMFERKPTNEEIMITGLPSAVSTGLKNLEPYKFRNDGNDFLDITIRPINEEGKDNTLTHIPPEIWEIRYKCVIYDKDDLPGPDLTRKVKKFYFWDADYQKMLEKSISWSTATSKINPSTLVPNYQASLATDEQRKMPTGLAIKSILQDMNLSVDETNFDVGSTKIFYTAPHTHNVWDNLEYILNQHISSKNHNNDRVDLCLFDKDRFTQKFELMPMSKYFENAGHQTYVPGKYQIEHLFFEDMGAPRFNPLKSPILMTLTTDKDVKISQIKNYSFVDMAAGDNTEKMSTSPVYTYDFKTKTFGINFKYSNIQYLEESIKTNYIKDKVLSKGEYPLLTLNTNKLQNTKINPIFSVRNDVAAVQAKGLGKLLYDSLFLNQCLHFDVQGATMRRSGRFVAIDRQTFSDNNLDYKLCGQWFMTKIHHNFINDMYMNEVIAIKIHSYDNLNLKPNV